MTSGRERSCSRPETGNASSAWLDRGPRVRARDQGQSASPPRLTRGCVLFGFPTDSLVGVASDDPLCYRFRYRLGGTEMGYAVKKRNQWYAVGYEGLDPVTGRDRRR